MFCRGTAYGSLLRVGEHKAATATIGAFVGDWVKHYRLLVVVMSDGGKQFAAGFSENLGSEGVFHHMCGADSPCHIGRTERIGGALELQIALTTESFEPASKEERELLV